MAKIVYRQMPAPRELSQQIPAPRAKARMQSPRVGANCWCKSPGVRGGMVMDEIDTCITKHELNCAGYAGGGGGWLDSLGSSILSGNIYFGVFKKLIWTIVRG